MGGVVGPEQMGARRTLDRQQGRPGASLPTVRSEIDGLLRRDFPTVE